THAFTPQNIGQDLYSLRDDLAYSFNRHGRHTLKLGGEFLYHNTWNFAAANAQGIYDATGGPVPANIQDLFPVWDNISTWNVDALNPIMRSYRLGIGNFRTYVKRNSYASWAQDDWTITPKLTLNLGLRYDYANNLFAQDVALPPFLNAGRNSEKNDF